LLVTLLFYILPAPQATTSKIKKEALIEEIVIKKMMEDRG